MTAEEKLKELYKPMCPYHDRAHPSNGIEFVDCIPCHTDWERKKEAERIDLIANLVVERLIKK